MAPKKPAVKADVCCGGHHIVFAVIVFLLGIYYTLADLGYLAKPDVSLLSLLVLIIGLKLLLKHQKQ